MSSPSVGVIVVGDQVLVGDSSLFLDLHTRLHVCLDFKRQSLETAKDRDEGTLSNKTKLSNRRVQATKAST